jgi:excisionase family DNA binding protein
MRLQCVLENNPGYSLAEARAIARVGRTTIYKAIRNGELRAVKVGRRTLILQGDLYRWLEGSPPIVPKQGDSDDHGTPGAEIVRGTPENRPAIKNTHEALKDCLGKRVHESEASQ